MKKTFLMCFVVMNFLQSCGWQPPGNPNPGTILTEAKADADAGRYEDALAKHVWYHRNALAIEPSQHGVRLSYALGYWIKLGRAYLPAHKKLLSIRDETRRDVLNGPSPRESFNDYRAINEKLGAESKTVELFKEVEALNPATASDLYLTAQDVLLRTGNDKLCAKYLDPENTWPVIKESYVLTVKITEERFGAKTAGVIRRRFTRETSILVALLSINGRKPEAEKIVEEAFEMLKDDGFKRGLRGI